MGWGRGIEGGVGGCVGVEGGVGGRGRRSVGVMHV